MRDETGKGKGAKLTRRGFGALTAAMAVVAAAFGIRKPGRRGSLSYKVANHWERVKSRGGKP